MKKFPRILIILIVILAVLFLGKNFFVKAAVQSGVKMVTGLPLKIKKLDIGIMTTKVGIEELSVMNPKGFPKEAMFHSPEIYVDYNLGALATGKVHLEEVRLDFDRFVIVKNEQGESNLNALKPKDKAQKEPAKEGPKATAKKKAPKIQIDHLKLRVGKVIYKDYSKGGEPSVKEFNVNISEDIKDVTNIQVLMGTIATKAIAKTALNSVLDFNTDLLKTTTEVPGQVVDKLKSTTDVLKNTIKLPFGNN